MAQFDLPEGPRELFYSAHRVLARHLSENGFLLGGGTALAARWHHRHSTDIDLFADAALYRSNLYSHEAQFRDDLTRELPDLKALSIFPGHCRITLAIGEISVFTAPALTTNSRSEDTVRNTNVYLETSAEIIARKIGLRMLQTGAIVPRDLYDIAVSPMHDIKALNTALDCISRENQRQIYDELRSLPHGWMERAEPPILSPTHPEQARHAVSIARDLFDISLKASIDRLQRSRDIDMGM